MPSMTSNKYRRGLPDETTSTTSPFCIPIPDDPQYRAAFFGALLRLGNSSIWDIEQTDKRIDVARWWNDYALSLMSEMTDCEGQGEPCSVVPLNSSRIVWFPESPFHPDAEVPTGYTFHPYTVVTGGLIDTIISEWGLGYQVGDVYTDLTKIPIATWLPTFIENLGNLPSFTIPNLENEGTVKIQFLNIPQGGRALIQVDDTFDVLNLRLVELNKDLVSFPQETEVGITIEVEITGTGTHSVKVTFLPTVDEALFPVFFGGGLRQIQICGFGLTDMPFDPCCPDEVDALQDIVEQNTTIVANLTAVVTNLTTIVTNLTTVINQGDTNIEQNYDVLLSNYQQQVQNWTISNQTVNELNQMIYDGTPQSIAPNLGADFNTTGGNDALCAAIKRYVENIVSAYTANINFAAAAAGLIGTAAAAIIIGATLGAAAPLVGAWGLIASAAIGAPVAAWNLVAASTEGKRKVECCMYDSLKDQAIDMATFKAAVADCSFDPTSAEGRIAGLIHDWSQSDSEYLAFLRMLGQETGGNSGDCVCGCDSDIELEDFAGTGCNITSLGNCIWRFVQTTPTVIGEATVYYYSFRDILSQCLLVENSPDPTMPTVGVGLDTTSTDCDNVETAHYVGGFSGSDSNLISAHWSQADVVNYFKITLVP